MQQKKKKLLQFLSRSALAGGNDTVGDTLDAAVFASAIKEEAETAKRSHKPNLKKSKNKISIFFKSICEKYLFFFFLGLNK